jgi:hypothetical protein
VHWRLLCCWAGISGDATEAAIRQTDFSAVRQQVANGDVTGFPAGSRFGPSGSIVNCPVLSLDVNAGG